jgi:hypothetical protein
MFYFLGTKMGVFIYNSRKYEPGLSVIYFRRQTQSSKIAPVTDLLKYEITPYA